MTRAPRFKCRAPSFGMRNVGRREEGCGGIRDEQVHVVVLQHEFIRPGPEFLPNATSVEVVKGPASRGWVSVPTDPHESLGIVHDAELPDDVHPECLLGLEKVLLEVLDECVDRP